MRKLSSIFSGTGILLLVAALILILYNIHSDNHAKAASNEVVAILSENAFGEMVPETENKEMDDAIKVADEAVDSLEQETVIPDYELNPDMEMPLQTVNGQDYIGVLTLEELSLELPVMRDWDYPKLKESPCCYYGSAYQDNFVIMAHNFQCHFGKIRNLSVGSIVTFKDMDNNIFTYEVIQTEMLNPTEVDTVKSGLWDLTLFTCTTGGQYRIAVRCDKV